MMMHHVIMMIVVMTVSDRQLALRLCFLVLVPAIPAHDASNPVADQD
jgi:hypothetical protein